MRVLIACEESGTVRDAFRALGHDAMSCDLKPSRHPGPHYMGSMFDLDYSEFDLVIAHPPCTALCIAGNGTYAGTEARKEALLFVERVWNLPVKKLCIENPIGVISTQLWWMPTPQYIQPWMFGHGETKKTGLWKRGLPDLVPTNVVPQRKQRIWKMAESQYRSMMRSQTYKGIASAMAEQWGISHELPRTC